MYSVSNCSQSSPLSDEDFIRDLDYKDFVADDSHTSSNISTAYIKTPQFVNKNV